MIADITRAIYVEAHLPWPWSTCVSGILAVIGVKFMEVKHEM